MTLMDAPKFDAAASRRRVLWIRGVFAALLVFVVGMWLFTGRPLDFPWTWWTYWAAERDANQFLQAVESNDLNRAYAIWVNDFDWQQHQANYAKYPFDRFKEDWGRDSMGNDYGTITSHRVVARKLSSNQLIVGFLVNGRKSKPLFLAYDKKEHTLGFSPFELSIDPVNPNAP
jgi:hypothetical protein